MSVTNEHCKHCILQQQVAEASETIREWQDKAERNAVALKLAQEMLADAVWGSHHPVAAATLKLAQGRLADAERKADEWGAKAEWLARQLAKYPGEYGEGPLDQTQDPEYWLQCANEWVAYRGGRNDTDER